jgi:hypothetical protein
MISWLENFSFSDAVVALTLLVSAIAAYFNLDSKLNIIDDKVSDIEKSQDTLTLELKTVEIEHKKDLLNAKTVADTRFSVLEERQRVTDVFIGRFDEKMTYLVDQVRSLASYMEKRNDK